MLTEDEMEWLSDALYSADDSPLMLNDWEKTFVASTIERVEKYGIDTRMSPKQWAAMNRIADKIGVPKYHAEE